MLCTLKSLCFQSSDKKVYLILNMVTLNKSFSFDFCVINREPFIRYIIFSMIQILGSNNSKKHFKFTFTIKSIDTNFPYQGWIVMFYLMIVMFGYSFFYIIVLYLPTHYFPHLARDISFFGLTPTTQGDELTFIINFSPLVIFYQCFVWSNLQHFTVFLAGTLITIFKSSRACITCVDYFVHAYKLL